jgi:hypothetical protein
VANSEYAQDYINITWIQDTTTYFISKHMKTFHNSK